MNDFNLKNLKPDIRCLKDMGNVLYDKEWQKTADLDLELYYMYRGLAEKDNFRYDITVIPSLMLGKEFNKTKGHQHLGNYQEIYIVLKGEAIYLIQQAENDAIKDVFAVKAKAGDICLIPAGATHFTINPSDQELKMANWIDKNCQSDYNSIDNKQGACYFYTLNGWLKNQNYKNIPPLRFEEPQKSFPQELSFLNK